jgi:hypothetical protein
MSNNGILESLGVKGLENEIKNLTAEIGKAFEAMKGYDKIFNDTFAEAVKSYKELKKSMDFTELNAGMEKATKAVNE